MSGTTFLVACMKKSVSELQTANIEAAARQHQIPLDYARFYVREELNRKGG